MLFLASILIYLILGLICGIFNALIGFGGGFFIVPSMYWILQFVVVLPQNQSIKIAIATSLLVMLINSTNLIIQFYKKKKLNWQLGVKYILPISIGSLFTIFFAHELTGDILRYAFIAYLILSIGLALNKKFFQISKTLLTLHKHTPGVKGWIFGIATGFSASLLGVEGSVLTVPYFRKRGINMNEAVPLAVLLTLPLSLIGIIAYMIAGDGLHIAQHLPYSIGYVYFPAVIAIAIGAYFGAKLGIIASDKIPHSLYTKGYISMMFLVLIVMLL